jgi:hypothetical protein
LRTSSGHSIAVAWRSAWSHVSQGGLYGRHRLKKAINEQVDEHARWHRKQAGEVLNKTS